MPRMVPWPRQQWDRNVQAKNNDVVSAALAATMEPIGAPVSQYSFA